MYKFFTKNGQFLAFGLGGIAILIYYLIVASGVGEFNALPEEERDTSNLFNFGINVSITFAIVCAVLMVVFGVFQVFTNLRASLKGLIGLAVIVIIFIVSYSASPTECFGEDISANACKIVGGGITTVLILAGLATLAFVLTEIRNLFK